MIANASKHILDAFYFFFWLSLTVHLRISKDFVKDKYNCDLSNDLK